MTEPITTPVEDVLEPDPYEGISPQQSRMVAYRNALDEALHERLQAVGEDLEPMALDGAQVITHRDMELAVRLTAFPPPTVHAADVETPATVTVFGVCPNCGEGSYLSTALTVELRVGTSRELRLVSSSSKASHSCGQQAFRVAAEGQQTIDEALDAQAEEGEDDEDLGDDDDESVEGDGDE